MTHTEENLKQRHKWRILLYKTAYQIAILLIGGILLGAGWLGWLGFTEVQKNNPVQPEWTPIYIALSTGLFGLAIALWFMLMLWSVRIREAVVERDFAHLFLHFAQKYLSGIVPYAEKCQTSAELFAACKKAGIEASQTAVAQAASVEQIMLELRESDIDAQFHDLSGFIATINRQLAMYNEQLEQAWILEEQRRETLERLVETRDRTAEIEQKTSELLEQSNVTNFRPAE